MTIVRYTTAELKKMKSQTDWEHLKKYKDGDIDYEVPEDEDIAELFVTGSIRRGRPKLLTPKKSVNIRLDQDVLDGLKSTGRNWSTRINDVMRQHLSSIGLL